MPLTKEQEEQLAELERLRDEPEPASSNRQDIVTFTVDLSDEAAVNRALGLGLLRQSDVDDQDDDDDDQDDDDQDDDDDAGGKPKSGQGRRKPKPETPPKRGGYFGDK